MYPTVFKCLSICFWLLAISSPGLLPAHPAWGIAVDNDGSIWFTDLFHQEGVLWRLEQGGELRAVMTGLHSHSLSAGPHGSVWVAEHLWVEGRIEGDGRNTLYRVRRDGNVEQLFRTRDGDLFYGGIVAVDHRGSVYFMREERLFRWNAGRRPMLVTSHRFDRIVTTHASRDGCLYLVDNHYRGGSLLRVDPADGHTELIASDLLEPRPVDPPFPDPNHNLLFGIAEDGAGHFYICNSGSRWVWRIVPGSEKKVVYRSASPWYPVGIAFRDGATVILECGFVEGEGHRGPRLVEWRMGAEKPSLLVDTDHPQQDCEWCGAQDAPEDPSWETRLAPPGEPGEPLVMEGRVYELDGKTPAAGVLVYVYHTNAEGIYPRRGDETGNGRRHGYLRGWMKTDDQGRYRFTTIRPAPYPNRRDPAHIHMTLKPPDEEEYWINSTWFRGDPLITEEQRCSLKRPAGPTNIVELKRNSEGGWRGKRDIVLRQVER